MKTLKLLFAASAAVMMALCVCAGVPTGLFVNGVSVGDVTAGEGWRYLGSTLYMTNSGPFEITGSAPDLDIRVQASCTITLSSVTLEGYSQICLDNIDGRQETFVTLALVGANELSANYSAGIEVSEGVTLTIAEGAAGASLEVYGGLDAAAIGSCSYSTSVGTIRLTGGDVTAVAGGSAAAVGGGAFSNGGLVVLSGGSLTVDSDLANKVGGGYGAKDPGTFERTGGSYHEIPHTVEDTGVAVNGEAVGIATSGTGWTFDYPVLHLTGPGPYELSGESMTASFSVSVEADTALTLNGLNVTTRSFSPIAIRDGCAVTMTLAGKSRLYAYSPLAGITLPAHASLTVDGPDDAMLEVESNDYAPAIGCGDTLDEVPTANNSCGAFTLRGGRVVATAWDSPAIGSVLYGNGGDVTLAGGRLVAEGRWSDMNIGTADIGGDCGSLTITGGSLSVGAGVIPTPHNASVSGALRLGRVSVTGLTPNGDAVTVAGLVNLPNDGYAYGTKSILPDMNGAIHLYLPIREAPYEFTVDGAPYVMATPHVPPIGLLVNGVDASAGGGEGWSETAGTIVLRDGEFTLSGDAEGEVSVLIAGDAQVVLSNLCLKCWDYRNALRVMPGARANLDLRGTNVLAATHRSGVLVSAGATLHVAGETDAILLALTMDNEYYAGIELLQGAKLEVAGGQVYACGLGMGAGVGGSIGGDGGEVVVTGGVLGASGGNHADDIGAGAYGIDGGSLTVMGGSVLTARGRRPEPRSSAAAGSRPLVQYLLELPDCADGQPVEISLPGFESINGYAYGTEGICGNIAGEVSLYLPRREEGYEIVVNGETDRIYPPLTNIDTGYRVNGQPVILGASGDGWCCTGYDLRMRNSGETCCPNAAAGSWIQIAVTPGIIGTGSTGSVVIVGPGEEVVSPVIPTHTEYVLHLEGGGPFVIDGECEEPAASVSIQVEADCTVTLSNLTASSSYDVPFQVCSGVSATLLVAGRVELMSYAARCGAIEVPSTASLVIDGTGTERPTLFAQGQLSAAGIDVFKGGSLTVNGGLILASGAYDSPGIGDRSHSGDVTINGGTVFAFGGNDDADDIGGNSNIDEEDRGTLTITGGSVCLAGGRSPTPRNAASSGGLSLRCVKLTDDSWTRARPLEVTGPADIPNDGYVYGTKDLYVCDDIPGTVQPFYDCEYVAELGRSLYLWLPPREAQYDFVVEGEANAAFALGPDTGIRVNGQVVRDGVPGTGWTYDGITLTLSGEGPYVLTGVSTNRLVFVRVAHDAAITFDGLTLTADSRSADCRDGLGRRYCPFALDLGVNVALTLARGTSRLDGRWMPAIRLPETASLTIDGDDYGRLETRCPSVSSAIVGPVIGGYEGETCGALTLAGAYLKVDVFQEESWGGRPRSQIGGGVGGNGGRVTVLGGTLDCGRIGAGVDGTDEGSFVVMGGGIIDCGTDDHSQWPRSSQESGSLPLCPCRIDVPYVDRPAVITGLTGLPDSGYAYGTRSIWPTAYLNGTNGYIQICLPSSSHRHYYTFACDGVKYAVQCMPDTEKRVEPVKFDDYAINLTVDGEQVIRGFIGNGWSFPERDYKMELAGGVYKLGQITESAVQNLSVVITDDTTLTLDNVDLVGECCGILIEPGATLTLKPKGENRILASGMTWNCGSGIYVPPSATLIVDGDEDSVLTAIGSNANPGIGGAYNMYATLRLYYPSLEKNCGRVEIRNGRVRAFGSIGTPSIGGTNNGDGGDVVISGGTVELLEERDSVILRGDYGIGAGVSGQSHGTLTITGGTVSGRLRCAPVNAESSGALGLAHVIVSDIPGDLSQPVTVTGLTNLPNDGYHYGVDALYVDRLDQLHVYLPTNEVGYSFVCNGRRFATSADTVGDYTAEQINLGFDINGERVGDVLSGEGWAYEVGSRRLVFTGTGPFVLFGTNTAAEVTLVVTNTQVVAMTLRDFVFTGKTSALKLEGGARLVLTLEGANALAANGFGCAALSAPEYGLSTVKVYGGEGDSLRVTGAYKGAGIGGDIGVDSAPFYLYGGEVIAQGGPYAAGIGGGGGNYVGSDGDLVTAGGNGGYVGVEGGVLRAKGGLCAAGIGGGLHGSMRSYMVVNGGTVVAETGGSFHPVKGQTHRVTNYGNVHMVTVGGFAPNGPRVTSLNGLENFRTAVGSKASYGMTDLYPDELGRLYLWLPDNADLYRFTIDGTDYLVRVNGRDARATRYMASLGVSVDGQEIGQVLEGDGWWVEGTETDYAIRFTAKGRHVLSGNNVSGTLRFVAEADVSLLLSNLVVNASGDALALNAGVSATLESVGFNLLQTDVSGAAGVLVPSGASVTFAGDAADELQVTATGGGAAIGGATGTGCGAITFAGGSVGASAAGGGAAVGGASGGNGGTVAVTGGRIVAEAEGRSAFGGGLNGTAGSLTISGGTLVGSVQAGGAFVMTGGSWTPGDGVASAKPVNAASSGSKQLRCVTVTGLSLSDDAPICSELTGLPDDGYNYGLTDIFSDGDGQVYLWLPDASEPYVFAIGSAVRTAKVSGADVTAAEYNPWRYEIRDGLAVVTGCEPCAGALVMPSSLGDETVVAVANGAFQNCSQLVSIQLAPAVTTIGQNAFKGCTSLKEVTGTASVTNLGTSAFESCSSLTHVELPEGLTQIALSTFKNCTQLKTIEIPSTVRLIRNGAFSGAGLTTVVVPEGVTNIMQTAFQACTSLKTVYLPSTLETIGKNAFVNDTGVTDFYLASPQAPTVGATAFWKSIRNEPLDACVHVAPGSKGWNGDPTSSVLPETWQGMPIVQMAQQKTATFYGNGGSPAAQEATYVVGLKLGMLPSDPVCDGRAFDGWERTDTGASVTADTIMTENLSGVRARWIQIWTYEIVDGLATITRANDRLSGAVKVPDSFVGCPVVRIDDFAFRDCWRITSLDLPVDVLYVGDGAFSGCSRMASITGTEGLVALGAEAFEGCSSLVEFEFPVGVTTISWDLFSDCTSLARFTVTGPLTSIGKSAFRNCRALESVDLPPTLAEIGSGAFGGCSSLRELRLRVSAAPKVDLLAFPLLLHSDATVLVPSDSTGWDGVEGSTVRPAKWNGFSMVWEAPENDMMSDASVLTGADGLAYGSIAGATVDEDDVLTNLFGSVSRTVWWRWTAPVSGRVTFDTLMTVMGPSHRAADTVIAVFTLDAEAVAWNDNAADFGTTLSSCSFVCVEGTEYLIGVGDAGDGWDGMLVLRWTSGLQSQFAAWAAEKGLAGADAAWDAKPALWGGKWENAFIYTYGEGLADGTLAIMNISFDVNGKPVITAAPVVEGHDDFTPAVIGVPTLDDWTSPVILDHSGDDWTLPVGAEANFFRVRLSE